VSVLPEGACVGKALCAGALMRNERWADRRAISQVAARDVPRSGSLWDMSLCAMQ